MIRIVAIVEGDGEVKAVPVLLRRIGAAVAPRHAPEDRVRTGLHGKMEMRHQPAFVGDRVQERGVGRRLGGVERRQPQARQAGRAVEYPVHQRPELGPAPASAP